MFDKRSTLELLVLMIGSKVRKTDCDRVGLIVNAFDYQIPVQQGGYRMVPVVEVLVAQGRTEVWHADNITFTGE